MKCKSPGRGLPELLVFWQKLLSKTKPSLNFIISTL